MNAKPYPQSDYNHGIFTNIYGTGSVCRAKKAGGIFEMGSLEVTMGTKVTLDLSTSVNILYSC